MVIFGFMSMYWRIWIHVDITGFRRIPVDSCGCDRISTDACWFMWMQKDSKLMRIQTDSMNVWLYLFCGKERVVPTDSCISMRIRTDSSCGCQEARADRIGFISNQYDVLWIWVFNYTSICVNYEEIDTLVVPDFR